MMRLSWYKREVTFLIEMLLSRVLAKGLLSKLF